MGDLVEEDGIVLGLAHVLDPGPDPIREIGQNQDLQEILAETTGQDQDQLRGLRITTEKRMETDLHLEKERPQDLVLALSLALGLDPEAIKFFLTLPKPTAKKLLYKNPYFENWFNVSNALMHSISIGYLSGYTLYIITITFCS